MRRRLLREPLLHFFVAGVVLFAAWAWVNPDRLAGRPSASEAVRITSNEIAWLKETWARQWQQEPSETQLRGLVADYLREELLAREARALGLDRDDVIVRRRLAQKMTFLLEDTARTAEPAATELRRAYDRDPARFHTPARVSFEHAYFDPSERGAQAAKDALARLSNPGLPADPAAFGDRSLLPREFTDVDERAVAHQLGADFARALFQLDAPTWHGPIASTYGLHLVRIRSAAGTKQQTFEEARAELLEEWRRSMQQTAEAEYFDALLEKYDVAVDESVRPLLGPLSVAKVDAE